MKTDIEIFLQETKRLNALEYKDQPVVVVDIDDVIARFRQNFFGWLQEELGLSVDHENNEYYHDDASLGGQMTFQEAIDSFSTAGGMLQLTCNNNVVDSLRKLDSQGVWIHLITARPAEDFSLIRETVVWLHKHGIPYHAIDFSSKKLNTLATKQWYRDGNVMYAVDDAPVNVKEYIAGGVFVCVPRRGYNDGIDDQLVAYFDWEVDSLPFAAENEHMINR